MIVFVLGGIFMLYQKVYYESRDFYEEFYTAAPLMMHEFEPDATGLVLASKLYSNGEFNNALPVFDMMTKSNPKELSAYFYQGICLMEIDQHWNAIDMFEKSKQKPSLLDESEWFKILSLIALEKKEGKNRKEEAISLLEYYVQQDDFVYKKEAANTLLNDY